MVPFHTLRDVCRLNDCRIDKEVCSVLCAEFRHCDVTTQSGGATRTVKLLLLECQSSLQACQAISITEAFQKEYCSVQLSYL